MVRFRKYQAPRIVRPNEGSPRWLRLLLLLLMILGAGWLGYQQGSTGGSAGFAMLQPTDAKQQIKALEQERNDLRRELTMVKQSAEIDRESIVSVREKIKQFQDERLKMEEELAFLRGIVSTGSKKHTLQVQNFRLEPGLESGQYTYKFSVCQVINSGIVAKGRIEINVEGLQNGRSTVLNLSKLADDRADSIKMRFRFFQNIEGKLQIPDGFEPATINVEVKPSNDKLEPVKESYNWSPDS